MAYTMEDFIRDAHRGIIEHIDEFDPEERQAMLARMTVEDRLPGLDPALIEEWLQRSKH